MVNSYHSELLMLDIYIFPTKDLAVYDHLETFIKRMTNTICKFLLNIEGSTIKNSVFLK